MKKRFIITALVIAIISFIIIRLRFNKREIDKKRQAVAIVDVRIPVTASAVTEGTQDVGMVKTGILAPIKEARVLSAGNGYIKRLLFKLGDQVSQGQLLAVIDTRLLELDLQKVESNVSKLKNDLQTYTELLEGNAATQEKVNEIRQRYNDALNQAEYLRRQIADAGITAPTSGIIYSRSVEEGMYVATGTEIASIVNLSLLKVRVNLTEEEVYQVKPGQVVKLTTDAYPGRAFSGTITFVSPQVNQAYNYPVEITAGNNKDAPLRSGTFVYADFSKKTSQKVLLIPRDALIASTRDASVYVIKNGKALLCPIQAGEEYGNNIRVASGLQHGDTVVTSGQINLKDGTLIKISK